MLPVSAMRRASVGRSKSWHNSRPIAAAVEVLAAHHLSDLQGRRSNATARATTAATATTATPGRSGWLRTRREAVDDPTQGESGNAAGQDVGDEGGGET